MNHSRRTFLETLLAGCAMSGGVPMAQAAAKPSPNIFAGGRRQLLFDDYLVGMGGPKLEDYPFNISWAPGKFEKSTRNSILEADQPWENGTAWLCVLRDGGRYRLWCNASSKSEPGLFVSYAESDDGLTWRKPILNLIEKNGSRQNNIVYTGGPDGWTLELGSVFIDPTARPEERYKMFYPTWDSRHVYPNDGLPFSIEAGVIRGAYSPDGLHWTRYQQIFLGKYADSQNVAVYDPYTGKYVAYFRTNASYGGLDVGEHPVRPASRGRALARMESEDYVRWSYPELAMAADFQDGLNVEIYNNAYSRYEGADHAHFLFPSFYHKREGTFHVGIATSRDNRTWMRPVRHTMIPLGEPGSFDDFIISVAPGFVPIGQDRIALYYRSGNGPHGGAIPSVKAHVPQPKGGMGRVTFKRDRIIGVEAGRDEGAFATRHLILEGRRIVLNAEPSGPDSEIRVQLIGAGLVPAQSPSRGKFMDDGVVPGYSFAESIPITADSLDASVRWKHGAELGEWAGKPARLHFRMRSMRLYAFQCVS